MPQQQHSHSMLSEASYHNMTVGRIPSVEGGIQPTLLDAKGDLISATAADTPARLAVGTNNQVVMADSAQATGLKYANEATATLTTTGDILYASGANTLARRAIGSTGDVLTVSGGVPTWAAPAGGGLTMSSIANGTASGASLSITGLSSYDQIDFMITGITQTVNDNFLFRINSNTGANYQSVFLIQSGSTSDYTFGTSETSFIVTPNDAKGAAQSNQALYVRLTNCKSGFTTAEFIHYYRTSAGTGYSNWQMGTYKVSEAVSSFQLTVASGTISGGSYRVFAG